MNPMDSAGFPAMTRQSVSTGESRIRLHWERALQQSGVQSGVSVASTPSAPRSTPVASASSRVAVPVGTLWTVPSVLGQVAALPQASAAPVAPDHGLAGTAATGSRTGVVAPMTAAESVREPNVRLRAFSALSPSLSQTYRPVAESRVVLTGHGEGATLWLRDFRRLPALWPALIRTIRCCLGRLETPVVRIVVNGKPYDGPT